MATDEFPSFEEFIEILNGMVTDGILEAFIRSDGQRAYRPATTAALDSSTATGRFLNANGIGKSS